LNSSLLVFLDRQHAGKPFSPRDRGAWGDLDHNGKQEIEELEAMLTAQYLFHAEVALLVANVAVLPISDGAYSERHARVVRYASTRPGAYVYIAAHLNAGKGRYGSVFYDQRSKHGRELATTIGDELSALPELDSVAIIGVREGSRHAPDWGLAYNTIAGVYHGRPVGICYEPAFIDAPEHARLFTYDGLRCLGRALANGILNWHQGR
jgi:hypothetical protein